MASWRLTCWFAAVALLTIYGLSRASADDHPPAPSAAETTPGEAAKSDAAESHEVDYNKPPIPGFAPGLVTLFVFSLVLFGGFVLASRCLIWGPLIGALNQREARVNQAHADAEAAKVQAEQLLATHSARMADVHEQVQGIVAAARKEAEQEKTRIIAEAEAQAKTLRDRAVAEIQSARDAALGQLNESLDGQIAQAVQHVVGHAV